MNCVIVKLEVATKRTISLQNDCKTIIFFCSKLVLLCINSYKIIAVTKH